MKHEDNRREALLRVCARLFRQKGFDATRIRDISRAAGMHSGSPFYHFESKQHMLLAVMEEGLSAGLRRLEAAAAADLPPREKLRRLVRAHLGTILERGNDFIAVMLYDWRALTPAHRKRIIALKDRYDALWQGHIAELERAGLIRGDPQLARLFMFGALNWSAQWYRPGGRCSLDQIADAATEFFLGKPSFKQVVNAALRKDLCGARRKPAPRFRQRTFDLGKPLVDLTKALSLAAELEDTETVSRRRRRGSGR